MEEVVELNERVTSLRSQKETSLISIYIDTYTNMINENINECRNNKYTCELERHAVTECFKDTVTESNYNEIKDCYMQHNDCWNNLHNGEFSTDYEEICSKLKSNDGEADC